MAPSPSRSASSEEDTSSGSSDHDEVEQQPPRLPEQQDDGSDDDDDRDEEESDEDTGDNGAAPKLPPPASNDVVEDSDSDADDMPPKKTNGKGPSPSAPQSSSEEDDNSGDEEESDEKDGAPPPQGTNKVRDSASDSEDYQVPDTESRPDEAPPGNPTEKPQRTRKPTSTPESPQLKRIRPAEVAEDALPRSDVDKLFKNKCDSYPVLGDEVLALEAKYPGMIKAAFLKIDDNKAGDLNAKLLKQRIAEIKTSLRRGDMQKEVTNALIHLLK